MNEISLKKIKELNIANEIVAKIRQFGVNDNIILMIFQQLSLDLENIELMKNIRAVLEGKTTLSDIKNIGESELEKLYESN